MIACNGGRGGPPPPPPGPPIAGCDAPDDPTVLHPIATCSATSGGHAYVVWGYRNDASTTVHVAPGAFNGFSFAPHTRGQPIAFDPGEHDAVFATVDDRSSWHLGDESVGPAFVPECDGVRTTFQGPVALVGKVQVPLSVDPAGALTHAIEATRVNFGSANGGPARTVGAIPHEFHVTDGGSASVTVPLDVPKGVAGMEPSLAIGYTGSTANGLLGVGFHLGGFSEIARCPRTFAIDGYAAPIGFDANDRLCLDGDVLIEKSRSGQGPTAQIEYRAEHDPFTKIVSTGGDSEGPATFTVFLRNGRIREYGGGSASFEGERIHYVGNDADRSDPTRTTQRVRYAWSLASERDRSGNTIAYSYESTIVDIPINIADVEPYTIHRPTRIDYTATADGPARRAVTFTYEDRQDPYQHYVAGLQVSTPQRLSEIRMFGPNPDAQGLLWSYRLHYDGEGIANAPGKAQVAEPGVSSILTSIDQCDGGGTCKQPTTFEWERQRDTPEFVDVRTQITGSQITYDGPPASAENPDARSSNHWALVVGDIDGDGRDDVMYRQRTGPQNDDTDSWVWVWARSLGTGFTDPRPVFGALVSENDIPWTQQVPLPRLVDLDGDGRVEVLMPKHGRGDAPIGGTFSAGFMPATWTVYKWNPAAFELQEVPQSQEQNGFFTFGATDCPIDPTPCAQTWPEPLYVGDFDGSGRPDFVRAWDPAFTWDPTTERATIVGTDHGAFWGARTDPANASSSYGPLAPSGVYQYVHDSGNTYIVNLDGSGRSAFLYEAVQTFGGVEAPGLRYEAYAVRNGAAERLDTALVVGSSAGQATNEDFHYLFFDANGDGLDDALRIPNAPAQLNLEGGVRPSLILNSGNGFATAHGAIASSSQNADKEEFDVRDALTPDTGERVLDFDGDGRADILLFGAHGSFSNDATVSHGNDLLRDRAVVYRSLGGQLTIQEGLPIAGSSAVVPLGRYIPGRGYPLSQLIDVNGDGLEDIVEMPENDEEFLHLYIRQGIAGDRLKAVHDGNGGGAQVTYAPHVEPVLDDASCTYPRRCGTRGQWVVSDAELLAGSTALAEFAASYSGAASDLWGRGSLGFSNRVWTYKATGLQEGRSFDNATRVLVDLGGGRQGVRYPFDGAPSFESWTVQAGTESLVRFASHEFQIIGGDAAKGDPYSVVEHHTSESSFSNLRRLRDIETTNTYLPEDGFGDLLERKVQGIESGTIEDTTFKYQNDATTWLIGLPTKVQTVSEIGGESKTRTTSTVYDDRGLPTDFYREPDSADPSLYLHQQFVHDQVGRLVAVEANDLAGTFREVRAISYDAIDGVFPASVSNAAGHTTHVVYHPGLGVLGRVTDPNGATTRYVHDRFGRLAQEQHPDGNIVNVLYETSPVGALAVESFSSAGGDERRHFDELGRVILRESIGPDRRWRQQTIAYDFVQIGQPRSVDVPHLAGDSAPGTQFRYDASGRLIEQILPDGATIRVAFDGSQTTETDANSHQRVLLRDELGRPLTSVEKGVSSVDSLSPHDVSMSYRYGPFGLLEHATYGPNGAYDVATTYDTVGRRLTTNDPDAGLTTVAYDAFDGVVGQTDANGTQTLFVRDALERLEASTNAIDGTTCIDWDAAPHGVGKIASAKALQPGVETNFSFDGIGRLVHEETVVDGAAYAIDTEYDDVGRVVRTRYPSTFGDRLVTHNAFGGDGSVVGVAQSLEATTSPLANVWTATAFDSTGHLTGESFGNGANTRRVVDVRDHVRTITTTHSGATVQSLRFDYDGDGNLHHRFDDTQGTTETFNYDSLDRLVEWQGTNGIWASAPFDATFGYDDLGNLRTRAFSSSLTTTSLSYDVAGALPHAVTGLGGNGGYKYDFAGNQTNTPLRTVDYSTFGLPTRITSGKGDTEFLYDAFDARTKKIDANGTTIYVAGLFERRTHAATSTESDVFYIAANGRIVAQVDWTRGPTTNNKPTVLRRTSYLHDDHLGTTHTITDQSGNVVDAQRFDPWGMRIDPANPGSAIASPKSDVEIGFTGQEHDDALGLIDMHGRVYDPKLGKFLSPDPFVQAPLSVESFNRYGYVFNNPLSLVDPSGFDTAATANDDNAPFTRGVNGPNWWWGSDGTLNIEVHGEKKQRSLAAGVAAAAAVKVDDNGASRECQGNCHAEVETASLSGAPRLHWDPSLVSAWATQAQPSTPAPSPLPGEDEDTVGRITGGIWAHVLRTIGTLNEWGFTLYPPARWSHDAVHALFEGLNRSYEGWSPNAKETWQSAQEYFAAEGLPVGVAVIVLEGREGLLAEQLELQFGEKASAAAKSFGSGRGAHAALVTVYRDGYVIAAESMTSGNMTSAEAALGFPNSTLATHTEARASQFPLQAGDTMVIEGQYEACPRCKGAMNQAARASGAEIYYLWDGNVWSTKR